jgi:hypothetical protein
VIVDTNTLIVNANENRVGIATTNPAYPLDVTGVIRSSSNFYSFATAGIQVLLNGSGSSMVDLNDSPDVWSLAWSSGTSLGTLFTMGICSCYIPLV